MSDAICSLHGCERPAQPVSGVCRPCWKRANRVSKRRPVDMIPGETWREIPGYPRYRASSLGRICRLEPESRPRALKHLTPSRSGYLKTTLTDSGGTARLFLVHRLVALAFRGECPTGMEVRHLDGNPANNRVENLRYGTSSENKLDTVRHGNHHQRRKTHCDHGHAFTPENTEIQRGGLRRCRTCHRDSNRGTAARARARRKLQMSAPTEAAS